MNLIITSGNIYNLIIMFVPGMSFSEIHNIIRTLDMRASVDLIFSSWHCGFRRVFLNKLPASLTALLNTAVSYCQVWGQAVHDDVIKWKRFPRYWPFVWGIHRSPVNSPHKRPVTRSFDVFFDLCLNKRLSRQLWGWWFETTSCSLWRHCNVHTMMCLCHTCKSVTFWSLPHLSMLDNMNVTQYYKLACNIDDFIWEYNG